MTLCQSGTLLAAVRFLRDVAAANGSCRAGFSVAMDSGCSTGNRSEKLAYDCTRGGQRGSHSNPLLCTHDLVWRHEDDTL